jgi:beta-galactosidase
MYRFIPFLGLFLFLFACSQPEAPGLSFDQDWKFLLSGEIDGSKPELDDIQWRTLSLPHDWSIENLPVQDSSHIGPFIRENRDSIDAGYTTGGTGWYRKHFLTEYRMKGKITEAVFDGVMERSDVWINGHHLGFHPNGYTPFRYDITSFLLPVGEENILAVRAYNPGENSRWYSGSGIYRSVRLSVSGKIYVPEWETRIITKVDSSGQARIDVSFPVLNTYHRPENIRVLIHITDADRRIVCSCQTGKTIPAQDTSEINVSLPLEKPNLWSPDRPYLYNIETSVRRQLGKIDSKEQTFGIRTLSFSAAKGFLLNGESELLKGACVHHDNGLLGVAAYPDAEIRKVRLLKKAGFNAIRTSHNPPSSAFLDACDSIGMLVIEEAFDCWEHPKRRNDYHLFFKKYAEDDLASMIVRDRNHPSVIMWSIGNEIFERADFAGLSIAKRLIAVIRGLDTTRPVTQAICGFWEQNGKTWDDSSPAFHLLDVGGYNYKWDQYDSDHKKFPDRIMVGTESYSGEMFESWRKVMENPFVIGDFVWTGMDYIGETGIGNAIYDRSSNKFAVPHRSWPWYLSGCGEMDICGNRKASSCYRKVLWGQSNLEILVHEPVPKGKTEHVSKWGWPQEYPHWNWRGYEGQPLDISVFTTCDSVRLRLNHKEIVTKPVDNKLTACFTINYVPGELIAEGITQGNIVCTKKLRTSGTPVKIRLGSDRNSVIAKPNGLIFVQIEVVDKEGNLVSDASLNCKISVKGEGELLTCGNAASDGMSSFRQPLHTVFYQGRCMAVIRSNGVPGKIMLLVETKDLSPEQYEFITKPDIWLL